MKLAEALAQRAAMQARMTRIANRATQNARFQEGDQPAEDPNALLAEYDRLVDELTGLIVRINTTNLATEVEPGLSMTAALALRDGFRMRHRVRTELADAASQAQDRFTRTELRYVPAVDVRALRQEADDAAQRAREVDILIQEVNWTTELDIG
jgi:hypothetical protein